MKERHAAPAVSPARTGASTGDAPVAAGTGARTTAAPAPAPKPKLRFVPRSEVFKPKRLRNEEEIEQYLQQAREQLLRDLEGYDAIQMN